ncbi:YppG family protein [Lentibacillus sp. Marseille-P4043]|uniref:YppG family protein n=1 Tax=Lentibacillus sp. Marseille-P4043 TaxID=2040293 RepID=UPI000D0ADAD4|nr:YppG family protein [Lentibacillus sp. Marseille-P4043]
MFERPYDNYQQYQAYTGYPNYYHVHPYYQMGHQQLQQPNSAVFQSPFDQFAKPKQPNNWHAVMGNQTSHNPYSTPKANGLFTYFQDKNGQVDLDKMFSTVGQFANTVQQISPVVKQVGSIMKNMK